MSEPLGDRTHYVGDSCPGGHRDDPFAASRLNDRLLELEELPAGGLLSDRQAALFAAVQLYASPNQFGSPSGFVLEEAEAFAAWLADDQADDAHVALECGDVLASYLDRPEIRCVLVKGHDGYHRDLLDHSWEWSGRG